MKYTILELVQRILESMDSDEVNSIGDTVESSAVANIIKEVYFEIISEVWPKDSSSLFHLDSSSDPSKPTLMFLPEDVDKLDWMKYNIGKGLQDTTFRELRFLPVVDFMDYLNGLDVSSPWVNSMTVSFDGHPFDIKYRNDVFPHYFTSPDDRTILFDSYDASIESTLTSSRTYCLGQKIPTLLLEDNFVPKLDARQFTLLLNKAKAQAFVELKQTENGIAEKKARVHTILAKKFRSDVDNRKELLKRRGYGR